MPLRSLLIVTVLGLASIVMGCSPQPAAEKTQVELEAVKKQLASALQDIEALRGEVNETRSQVRGANASRQFGELTAERPGALIEMETAGGVKSRIRACSEFPELIIGNNRSVDPTCGLPATFDDPTKVSSSIQLRADPSEEDILLYIDKGSEDRTHDAFLRLTPKGVVIGVAQADVSGVGLAEELTGLNVRGPGAGVQADYFLSKIDTYPFNSYGILDPNGSLLWYDRVEEGKLQYALVRYNGVGIPLMKWEQDGSVWVRDNETWRKL